MYSLPSQGTKGLVRFGELTRQLPPNSRIPILPNGIDTRSCESGLKVVPNALSQNAVFNDSEFDVLGWAQHWRFYWIFDRAGFEVNSARWTNSAIGPGSNNVESMPGTDANRIFRYNRLLKNHVGFQAIQETVQVSTAAAPEPVYATLTGVTTPRVKNVIQHNLGYGVGSKVAGIVWFDVTWSNPFRSALGQIPTGTTAAPLLPPNDFDFDTFNPLPATGSGQTLTQQIYHFIMGCYAGAGQTIARTGRLYLITNPGHTDADGVTQPELSGHTNPTPQDGGDWEEFPYEVIQPPEINLWSSDSTEVSFAPQPAENDVTFDRAFHKDQLVVDRFDEDTGVARMRIRVTGNVQKYFDTNMECVLDGLVWKADQARLVSATEWVLELRHQYFGAIGPNEHEIEPNNHVHYRLGEATLATNYTISS